MYMFMWIAARYAVLLSCEGLWQNNPETKASRELSEGGNGKPSEYHKNLCRELTSEFARALEVEQRTRLRTASFTKSVRVHYVSQIAIEYAVLVTVYVLQLTVIVDPARSEDQTAFWAWKGVPRWFACT
jgi:hypothetical protein